MNENKSYQNNPLQQDMTIKYTSSIFFSWSYLLWTGMSILIGLYSLALGAMQASTHLHYNILSNTLKSPIYFFDTTPLGRLVNRFSKDMDIIDREQQNGGWSVSTVFWALSSSSAMEPLVPCATDTLVNTLLSCSGTLWWQGYADENIF